MKNNVFLFLPIDKEICADIYRYDGLGEDLTCTIEVLLSLASLLFVYFFIREYERTFLRLYCVMAQPPSPTPQSSSSLVSVNPPTTVPYIKCNFLDKDTGMKFMDFPTGRKSHH